MTTLGQVCSKALLDQLPMGLILVAHHDSARERRCSPRVLQMPVVDGRGGVPHERSVASPPPSSSTACTVLRELRYHRAGCEAVREFVIALEGCASRRSPAVRQRLRRAGTGSQLGPVTACRLRRKSQPNARRETFASRAQAAVARAAARGGAKFSLRLRLPHAHPCRLTPGFFFQPRRPRG